MSLKKWVRDYKVMDAIFNNFHPKDGVMGGTGLFRNFFMELKERFGHKYDDRILHLVTRVLTRFRIRRMNKLFKEKEIAKRIARNKNKKRKSPISSRGNVHLAHRTTNC